MRLNKMLLLLLATSLSIGSCTRNVYVVKKMPPGQAKKMTGAKSAKAYAPGQRKKAR